MRNKGIILGLSILLGLSVTACGSQTEQPVSKETTAPTEETSTPETTIAPEDSSQKESEEPEQAEAADTKESTSEISGTIRTFTGGYLTLISDEDDEILEFNLKNAQIVCENGILAGDAVTVFYEGTIKSTNTRGAKVTKITDKQDKESLKKQLLIGTIADASTNTLTVKSTDGSAFSFVSTGTRVKCQNGLAPGSWVALSYMGELKSSNAKNIKVLSVSDRNEKISPAIEEAFITDIARKTVTAETARVYRQYTTDSELLATLPPGTPLNATGEYDNGWVRVDYNGEAAYIYESYLSSSPAATPTPAPPETPIPELEEKEMTAWIQSLDKNILTVKSQEDNASYLFDCGSATINVAYGLLESSEISITYTGKPGADPASSQAVRITDVEPEVVNQATGGTSITGTVMAWGSNCITIMSNDGAQITCTTESLIKEPEKEFTEGDYVTIVIKPNGDSNVHNALEIASVY